MIPESVKLVINTITDSQQQTKHINWEIPEVRNRSIFTRLSFWEAWWTLSTCMNVNWPFVLCIHRVHTTQLLVICGHHDLQFDCRGVTILWLATVPQFTSRGTGSSDSPRKEARVFPVSRKRSVESFVIITSCHIHSFVLIMKLNLLLSQFTN